jgi:hypothetical protein
MAIARQDHRSVAMAIPVPASRFDQPGHLSLSQILPRPILAVGQSHGHCSVISGWRDQSKMRFSHVLSLLFLMHWPYSTYKPNSCLSLEWAGRELPGYRIASANIPGVGRGGPSAPMLSKILCSLKSREAQKIHLY